jgi:hypothetical protein
MTRLGTTLARVFIAVAMLVASTGSARAQGAIGLADCAWLKIKVVGKGYEHDMTEHLLGPKRSVTATCYAQLVYTAPGGEFPNGRYTAPLICEDGLLWEASSAAEGLSATVLANGDAISDDDYLTFGNSGGDVVQGYASHLLTLALDRKTGALKKVAFRTLAGQMIDGSLYNRTPENIFGSYGARGASLAADKVPEGAREIMSEGMCE